MHSKENNKALACMNSICRLCCENARTNDGYLAERIVDTWSHRLSICSIIKTSPIPNGLCPPYRICSAEVTGIRIHSIDCLCASAHMHFRFQISDRNEKTACIESEIDLSFPMKETGSSASKFLRIGAEVSVRRFSVIDPYLANTHLEICLRFVVTDLRNCAIISKDKNNVCSLPLYPPVPSSGMNRCKITKLLDSCVCLE